MNTSVTSFEQKVYAATRLIPVGMVSTYALIATVIGHHFSQRAVGNALNKNPFRNVPCHRVVRSDGLVGGYFRGEKIKIKLLRKEGVRIQGGRVDPSAIHAPEGHWFARG